MKKLFTYSLLILSLLYVSNADAGTGKPPKNDYLITISTDVGDLKIILYDETANHKKKFIELIQKGHFKSSSFFKSVNNFFIQGGDKKTGTESLRKESGMPHKKGALGAMGSIDPNTEVKTSHISQFYIVTNPDGINFLNKNYTVFGEVVQGLEVLDKIAALDKDKDFFLSPELSFSITVEELKRKKITKLTGYNYPTADGN